MLRRMSWDIMRRAILFPGRVWRKPRRAYGDAAYVLGILSGAVQCLLTQRIYR